MFAIDPEPDPGPVFVANLTALIGCIVEGQGSSAHGYRVQLHQAVVFEILSGVHMRMRLTPSQRAER